MSRPSTVSLFCGAGGESLGKHLAFEELGLAQEDILSHAVNHWDLAVQAHGRNLPNVLVHQEDITEVTAQTYGLDRIQLLWASPSCVHHSRARGGKPREDQQRSHAWEVSDRWLRMAHVDVVLIENVPEFMEWGPLDDLGQPIPERKGEAFRAWVKDLESMGYLVDWRVLCAADYGAPTTRRRFFLQAVRDGKGIHWPEPTHRDPRKPADLFTGHLPAWRTAAECIDWSLPCPSIFDRKRPLKEATLRRIAAGVVRYVLQAKRPFIVNLSHGGRLEGMDEPLKTITTANRGEKAMVTPYMVNLRGTSAGQIQGSASSAEEPVHTISSGGIHQALIAPSLVGVGGRAGQSRPRGVDEPFGVLTTKADGAVVAAFVAKHYGGVVGQEVPRPLGTVTSVDHHSLVAASLIQTGYGEREGQAPRTLDIESPLGTVVAQGIKHGLAAVSITKFQENSIGQELEEPLHTVMAGAPRFGLVAAFLTQYYGTLNTSSPDQPLPTVTTLARHGLVTVEIDGETYALVDIGMRMLEPSELAAATGFPPSYLWLQGDGKPLTKRDQVKMIGNAVPPALAKALVLAVARPRPDLFKVREAIA